jgi:glycosyltransferase involved in cell wall biosynthesis
MSISVVILTKDNEAAISPLIRSLSWCDEVLIVDDNSVDKTREVAAELHAKVHQRPLDNDFAGQRNFGLSKVKNDWVLFIDADELVSKELAEEIQQVIQNPEFEAYKILRVDFFLGKQLKYGEFGSRRAYITRLGRKSKGKWGRKVHETWEFRRIGRLKNTLGHFPHPTISEFINHINWYSTLHAKENVQEKKRFTFLHVIFHPFGKFFVYFVLRQGYRDGTHGFVATMMMSFHSFLSWSKQWTKQY